LSLNMASPPFFPRQNTNKTHSRFRHPLSFPPSNDQAKPNPGGRLFFFFFRTNTAGAPPLPLFFLPSGIKMEKRRRADESVRPSPFFPSRERRPTRRFRPFFFRLLGWQNRALRAHHLSPFLFFFLPDGPSEKRERSPRPFFFSPCASRASFFPPFLFQYQR